MIRWTREHPTAAFLLLTFTLALIPWLVCLLAGIDPFSDLKWMPLLLGMVWSPTTSALLVSAARGEARALLSHLRVLPHQPLVWILALSPLPVLLLGLNVPSELGAGGLLFFLALQLALGPLGEELGWRAFLLPRLQPLGTLGAPLVVGLIWAVWHAPLWWLESPQAEIPFPLFLVTCVCFSILLSAGQWLAPRSVIPAVVFHWLANVTAGLVILGGTRSAAEVYEQALPYYLTAAALAALLNWRHEPRICLEVS